MTAKRKRKAFNITLAPDVREALERYAADSGRKPSHIIEEVLREFLKENGWLDYSASRKYTKTPKSAIYSETSVQGDDLMVAEEPPKKIKRRVG